MLRNRWTRCHMRILSAFSNTSDRALRRLGWRRSGDEQDGPKQDGPEQDEPEQDGPPRQLRSDPSEFWETMKAVAASTNREIMLISITHFGPALRICYPELRSPDA